MFCQQIEKEVVGEFIDGATGTDDARPEFRRMVEEAQQPGCTFDTIVVHSLSRFYRAGPEMELLIRSLQKRGVKVVSVTQPIGDDPVHAMLRQMIGMFDEYTSLENGKNVLRSMRENAEQGFWNGTTPPLGYRVVEVERRGTKIKKRLEIDPVEAEVVVRIFKTYLDGLPGSGPLGVKSTVAALNAAGLRTRGGSLFGVGPVHKILTSRYYADGIYSWGVTNSRTGEANDPEKVSKIPLPPIISLKIFDRVQTKLATNNPRTTPPRSSMVHASSLASPSALAGSV